MRTPLGLCRYCEPEKNDERSVESQNIFISEPANAFAGLRFWYGSDLVHHETTGHVEPVMVGRFYMQTE